MNELAATRLRRCHQCPECVVYPHFNAERCKAQGEADLTQALLEEVTAACPQGYWAGLTLVDRAQERFEFRERTRAQYRRQHVKALQWIIREWVQANGWAAGLALAKAIATRRPPWLWAVVDAARLWVAGGGTLPPGGLAKLCEEMCVELAGLGPEERALALEQLNWAFEAGCITAGEATAIEALL